MNKIKYIIIMNGKERNKQFQWGNMRREKIMSLYQIILGKKKIAKTNRDKCI